MRWTRSAISLGAAGVLLTLVGCGGIGSPGGALDDAPALSAEAQSPSPGEEWPEGASAAGPTCQEASASVVAAVNATIVDPPPGGDGVERISAHPDPLLGRWLLVGALDTTGSEGAYLVVWATIADPTVADFEGELTAVGSTARAVTSAPALSPPYSGASDMDEVPRGALACGASLTD